MADENSEIDKIIKVVIDEYKNEFQDDDTVMFNKIFKTLDYGAVLCAASSNL